MRTYLVSMFAALGLAAPTAALADEMQSTGFAEPTIIFHGGVGIVGIKADEYAYEGDAKLSQLIWQSTAPAFSAGLVARTDSGWTLALDGLVALRGKSKMNDYDWDPAFTTGDGTDDWSHYSHPAETRLNHYVSGSIAMGHDFALNDQASFNLNAGLKYFDVKWSGTGGSYIYSVDGFRDTSGTFADEPIIDYRQRYPSAFVGLDMSFHRDRWTFGFSAKGGVTFNATGLDHHLRRQIGFHDEIKPAPLLGLAGRLDYAVTDTLSLFVSGTYDRIFRARADETEFDIVSGATTALYPNDAGADFQAASLVIGLTKRF